MESSRKIVVAQLLVIFSGVVAMLGSGCSEPASLVDAGVEADVIPPSCTESFEYLESDVFGPPHPRPPAPVPAPIPPMRGTNRVVRPESGEIGVRSWWLATAEDARITLSLSASADILTGDDHVVIWSVINGQPARIAVVPSAGEQWHDRVDIPVVDQSATVTVRLDPENLHEGLNSVHFFYTLSTPGATVENRDDAFPSIVLFLGSTAVPPVRVDNDQVVRSDSRITFGVTEVSIGADGPSIGHVVGRVDEVEDGGLFVHAQTSEAMSGCRRPARFAYMVLVDGVPVPVTPDGDESIIVDVPHDQRILVPLAIGSLPRDDRSHRLQIRQIGGIGLPLEDDDGQLVLSGQLQSRLADIVW